MRLPLSITGLPLISLFAVAYGFQCVDLTIPVTVTSTSLTTAFAPFQDNYQATAFVDLITRRDAAAGLSPFSGPKTITNTYSIRAHYCTPEGQPVTKTLQILTHGLGFDKSYWNFNLVAGNYSYVEAATNAGYSTFAYDRLGTGLSTKSDPYNVVQAPTELAILTELTIMLKKTLISGCNAHESFVHVGHSYGSTLTNALVATAPQLSDGIILTGYSNNLTFQGLFLATTGHLASTNQPARFAGYSSGYLTWADKYYNQYSFLAYPYFDEAIATAAENNKFPFTIGEILTTGVVPLSAPNFTGPVLYLAAQFDNIFCGGDCAGIIDGPYSNSRSLFPAVSDAKYEVYIQPNVGHGINLHYNATGAYAVANGFLNNNGF